MQSEADTEEVNTRVRVVMKHFQHRRSAEAPVCHQSTAHLLLEPETAGILFALHPQTHDGSSATIFAVHPNFEMPLEGCCPPPPPFSIKPCNQGAAGAQ